MLKPVNSKVRARLQRLIVLRTIKLARSHCFYTRRWAQAKNPDANKISDL